MPTNQPRINLALPDDLQALVMRDAESFRIGAATRVMQIIDEHYKRKAAEQLRMAKVLKGSELLAGQSELTMDFSGEAGQAPAQADEPSKGANGA